MSGVPQKVGEVSTRTSDKAELVASVAATELVQAMASSARDKGGTCRQKKNRNFASRTLKKGQASKGQAVLKKGSSRTTPQMSKTRRKSFSKGGNEYVNDTAAATHTACGVAGQLNAISER